MIEHCSSFGLFQWICSGISLWFEFTKFIEHIAYAYQSSIYLLLWSIFLIFGLLFIVFFVFLFLNFYTSLFILNIKVLRYTYWKILSQKVTYYQFLSDVCWREKKRLIYLFFVFATFLYCLSILYFIALWSSLIPSFYVFWFIFLLLASNTEN